MVTNDEGELVADSLIAIQTELHCDKTSAVWTALDLTEDSEDGSAAQSHSFKASFYSEEDLKNFKEAFSEVCISKTCEI